MYRTSERLCQSSGLEGKIIWKWQQIVFSHSDTLCKGTGHPHANQFPASTQMFSATPASFACSAGHQRIDYDTLAGKLARLRHANRLVA
jgi:hypothetical protein